MRYARQMLMGKKPPRDDMPCLNCQMYEALKKYDNWISYREAIDIEPGLVAPYINLADLYRRQNRDNEGELALKSALDKYPDLAPIHYSLGLLKVRQGDHEEALEYLEQAARFDGSADIKGFEEYSSDESIEVEFGAETVN